MTGWKVISRRVPHLQLAKEVDLRPEAMIFLNRLSDVLFEMARAMNHDTNTPEREWLGPRDRSDT